VSWLSRQADERLVKAVRTRREVQRGPLPREGSPYVEEIVTPAQVASHVFGISTLFLVILIVLLVGSTFYYAQYSGALRWLVFAGLVGLAGLLAVRTLGAYVRDPTALAGRAVAAGGTGGDLRSLRTTLMRAEEGLAYSQVVFADRMRKAFLEKVRVSRSLTREAMDAAAKHLGTLNGLVGDRELTIFIMESARNARMYPASMPSVEKKPAFARHARGLLDRMEAWR
jgi:hypothetical protein